MASILVVEDQQLLGKTIKASLGDDGHQVHWVPSAEDAMEWLTNRHVDLALVDIRLPGIDGIDFLKALSQSHPDTIAIMMTAHGDVGTAVEAMKLGAADFLLKPLDLDAVSIVAKKNLQHNRINRSWKHEQKSRSQEFGLHQIIGDCAGIEKAKSMVRRIANLGVSADGCPPNVLITGETGTGKDLLARAFHYEGPRREGPFVQINCAALPEALIESELFGHTKGAFTDAGSGKRGLFEVADQGTLFLDEVGSLEPKMQAKLLTAIETGRIRPVGGVQEHAVNVHLIAAMNQDPAEWVKQGRLREDLYHRLRVVQVHLPPLRERGDDLFMLAQHFLSAHCRKFAAKTKGLTPESKERLRSYHWPGNVRELCHCLESAVLLSNGDALDLDVLPVGQRRSPPVKQDVECPNGAIPIDFSKGPIALEEVERQLICRALEATDHNLSRAAELLMISRDTMRYRVEKFEIKLKRNGTAR